MQELFDYLGTGLKFAFRNSKISSYLSLILLPLLMILGSFELTGRQKYPDLLILVGMLQLITFIILAGGLIAKVNESFPKRIGDLKNILGNGFKFFWKLSGIFGIYLVIWFTLQLSIYSLNETQEMSIIANVLVYGTALYVLYYVTPIFMISQLGIICGGINLVSSIKQACKLCNQKSIRVKFHLLLFMYLCIYGAFVGILAFIYAFLTLGNPTMRLYPLEYFFRGYIDSFLLISLSAIYIPFYQQLIRNTHAQLS
jgi:hypothetical protein